MFDILKNIINDNETVLSGFVSPAGITRLTGGDRLAVEQPIAVVSTDRRLVMAARSGDSTSALTIAYSDLASATVDGGDVSLTTTAGTAFTCQLASGGEVPVEQARRHVRWLGDVRSDVLGCRNDVELAAGELERQAEDLEWEEARRTYERARERLDRTLTTILATDSLDPVTVAPELTTAGRVLERAHARLHARRAESRLDLAQQLLETDAHEQCRKVLRQVQTFAAEARGCGHAVQRADRFQFGEQRGLQRELDSLRWRIGSFAAELVTGARDACVAAQEATARASALDEYRTALERYEHALALEESRDERQLIDSPERVRRERDRVAAQLIDLHERIADEHWDNGVDRQEAGERDAALQACIDAKGHFERAHDLATEFTPARTEPVAARLDTIKDVIAQMRTNEAVSERPPETGTGDTDPTQGRSAGDLAEIDTHHDIVLGADELGPTATDGSPADARSTAADSADAHSTAADSADAHSTTPAE